MYVIVGGAGEVGFHLARALREEGHDVAVVEPDADRVERLNDLDVLAIPGNIASKRLLEEEANIKDADLLIACSGHDEINLVACALAKTYGVKTIARLNDPEYIRERETRDYERMGVDHAVSPELVAAIRIQNLVNQSRLTKVDAFLSSKVFVAEARVTEGAFVIGKKIKDVEPPPGFNLFALYRGDDVIIPRGDTQFHVHDRLLMAMTSRDVLSDVESYIGRAKHVEQPGREIRRVMIAGATRIGIHLARLLESARKEVVLVEADREKCRTAGEQLDKTLVVHGKTTDRTLLIQENVDTFDIFIGATRSEERNILAAIMAKRLGVPMVVAVIDQPELKQDLEQLQIDLAVAPRLSTVGAILKHTHAHMGEVELQNVGEDAIVTFNLHEASPAVGKRVRKLALPRNCILAALTRGDEVIMPRGDTVLQAGDHVLAYAGAESLVALERLFK
jgi:trk system potassium uptake protein TrkA